MNKDFLMSCKAKDLGLFVLRLAVGGSFIYHGVSKFGDPAMVEGMLTGLGYPAPGLFAWLLILIEILFGAGLVLGVFTRLSGGVLAVTMLIAYLTVHMGQPYGEGELSVVFFASSLCLLLVGGGSWALMKEECKKK